MTSSKKNILIFAGLIAVMILTACGMNLTPVPTPTPTPTLVPTETLIPPVVTVNDEGISQVEFDAELSRYQQAQAALGNTVSPETARQTVMNDMVDEVLMAQAAAAYGFVVDDAMVQSRIDNLTSLIGGPDTLTAWETAHGYTDADFRFALRRQVAAAWMRDRIVSSIPTTAEQVHVKQILLYNADEANTVESQLQNGADFNGPAAQYDPLANGELGWFPRGYLTEKSIEDAAFTLQPGQYSPVIQTDSGYHILYLVEHDPARQLSPDALLTLQENAIGDWLTQRRTESTILYAP
jgi:peptidyl-prolyl cis-trans isomerase C